MKNVDRACVSRTMVMSLPGAGSKSGAYRPRLILALTIARRGSMKTVG